MLETTGLLPIYILAEAKVSGIIGYTGDIGQGGKPTKWFITELGLYTIQGGDVEIRPYNEED